MEERNDEKGLFLVLLTIFMMVTIHPLKAHAAETNGWTKRADLPEERLHSSSAVVDGKIFVFGEVVKNHIVIKIPTCMILTKMSGAQKLICQEKEQIVRQWR